MSWDEQIADLEKRKEELEKEIDDIENTIHRIRLVKIEEDFGIKVGSIVFGGDGKEYRVTEIDPNWYADRPWLRGNPRRKDGTFGISNRHLFDNWSIKQGG